MTGSETSVSHRPPDTACAPKAWTRAGRPVGVRPGLSPGRRELQEAQVRRREQQLPSSGTVLRALRGRPLRLRGSPFSGPSERTLQPVRLQDSPKATRLVSRRSETVTQDFLTPGPPPDCQASRLSRAVTAGVQSNHLSQDKAAGPLGSPKATPTAFSSPLCCSRAPFVSPVLGHTAPPSVKSRDL